MQHPKCNVPMQISKVVAILSCGPVIRTLRSKEAVSSLQAVHLVSWPMMFDIDEAPRKRIPINYRPPTPELLAYIDFSITTAGTLAGIKVSITVLY